MILRRLGNKKKMAAAIQAHFPKHDLYIEPFFGAGGMFFNKPKAKYNIMNDQDGEVYNLFMVVSTQMEELKAAWLSMPLSEHLWEYWKENKEEEPVRRAVRFLFLSNFGFMGKANTMRFGVENGAKILYENIDKTNKLLFETQFMNSCFRDMFKKISLRDEQDRAFIYCDPPYLDTANNYEQGFIKKDSVDLFDALEATGCKFAMSEFDHPFILGQARQRGLNVVDLGERRNLGNRRKEILITNYQNTQYSLFD